MFIRFTDVIVKYFTGVKFIRFTDVMVKYFTDI